MTILTHDTLTLPTPFVSRRPLFTAGRCTRMGAPCLG